MANALKALKVLKSYCLEEKDGETVNNILALTFKFESWNFILSIVIWHNLFQINQTSKVTETPGVLLKVVETEIKATEEVLKKYRINGYNSAVTCERKIAEALQIDSWFAESRPTEKRRMFEYEVKDQTFTKSQEDQFKANLFLQLIDHGIWCLKNPLSNA